MILSLIVSIIGMISVIAQAEHLFHYRLIDDKTLALLKIFFPPTIGISVFYLIHSPLLLGVIIILSAATPALLMGIHKHLRERRFNSRLFAFLDQLILELRSGTSLRLSLQNCRSDAFLQESWDIKEIASAIVEKSSPPTGILKNGKWLYEQVKKVEETQLKQLDRIVSLRSHYRREQRLMEKTRLASRQVETQVILCSLMFGALIIFTLKQYPLFWSHFLFWVSIALYSLGILFFYLLKRSFKCPL